MSRLEPASSASPSIPSPRSVPSSPTTESPEQAVRLGRDRSSLERHPHARDARDFERYLQNQNEDGRTNGCGTTSLAMLLSFWKGKPDAYSRGRIDLSIRHFDMPTSPQNLARYAEGQGFRTALQNHASLEDLTALLAQGVPAMVLFDPDGDDSDDTLHYVVATDFTTDDAGHLTHVRIADPLGGRMRDIPVDEFKERWDKLSVFHHTTGMSNVFLPMIPEENVPIRGRDGKVHLADDVALPEADGLGWRMGMMDQVADATNLAGRAADAVTDGARKLWGGIKRLI